MRVLGVRHAALDCLLVRRIDDGRFAETAFLFGRFVRQNVAMIRMVAYDFAASSHFKALSGAALCLHFWHGLSACIGAKVSEIAVQTHDCRPQTGDKPRQYTQNRTFCKSKRRAVSHGADTRKPPFLGVHS